MPEYRKRPGNNTERLDGIEYSVMLDPETNPEKDMVKFRMKIPEDYPNTLPRVYPADFDIKFNHNNHTYRDKKGNVHLCMLFEEDWTSDCTIAGLMVLSSIWMHKYSLWKKFGKWPGKGRKHCIKCGNIDAKCSC